MVAFVSIAVLKVITNGAVVPTSVVGDVETMTGWAREWVNGIAAAARPKSRVRTFLEERRDGFEFMITSRVTLPGCAAFRRHRSQKSTGLCPCDVVMEKSWQNPNRPATQICPYFVCSSRYCRRMNSSHNVSISTASISTFFV